MAQLIGKWKLIQAAGHPITVDSEFEFTAENRLSFNYGNHFFMNYEIDGNHIKFGVVGGTMMLFPQNPPEEVVTEAVTSSTDWTIHGDTLTLSIGAAPSVLLKKL